MEDNKVTVLVDRLPEAVEALKKLARKAERYGTPRITWRLGELRVEERTNLEGRKVRVQVQDLLMDTLEAPRVGDFRFIARLERTRAGTIIDSIPGEVLPERFRHATAECEHCRQARYRAHLFVVQDPEGTYVQVGRTCLRDYMGTDTPASVAARFRFLREAREWSEEWGLGSVVEDDVETLLAVTSAAIRLWGWVPKSAPEEAGTPTAFRIGAWFRCAPGNKMGLEDRDALRAALGEADWQAARDTIAWVASPEAGDSEYMHNLRVILAQGTVRADRRGYACSAVAAWQRHLGAMEERRRDAAASRHIGAVGERLRDLELTCTGIRDMGNNGYGPVVLYKLLDPEGNRFSWFCSGGAGLSVQGRYRVDATVKGHGEHNGVAETRLTRARVKEVL